MRGWRVTSRIQGKRGKDTSQFNAQTASILQALFWIAEPDARDIRDIPVASTAQSSRLYRPQANKLG